MLKKMILLIVTLLSFCLIYLSRTSQKFSEYKSPAQIFDSNSCPQFPIITFKTRGRLGNQMSSYANFLALSWQFGYQLYLPTKTKRDLEKIFKNVTFPTIEGEFLINRNCNIYQKGIYVYEKMEDFLQNILTCNLDQSCLPSAFGNILNVKINLDHNNPKWNLLTGSLRDLKKYHFQFHDNIMEKNKDLQRQIGSVSVAGGTLIGVHVRRTDYIWFRKHQTNLPPVNVTYYEAAISYYRAKYEQPTFLVVSDDTAWCKQHLTGHDVRVIEGGSPASDMALMSFCDHSIIDYGSYGVWGAVLAGGEVLTPGSTLHNTTKYGWEAGDGLLNWTIMEGF